MSEVAAIWAEYIADRARELGLDVLDCAILAKLASVTDDDDLAWMRVDDLASRVGSSVRNVQYRLRKLSGLEDWIKGKAAIPEKMIEDSGLTHEWGTRKIPRYRLFIDHQAVMDILAERKARREGRAMAASRMGATVCTHRADAPRNPCTDRGATVCTPKEPIGEQVSADAETAGARGAERSDLKGEGQLGPEPGSEPSVAFKAAFDAWAPHAVQSTEWEPSWAAWCEQAGPAGGEAKLAGVVEAFLAHPSIRTRSKPLKGFQWWLRNGGWRASAAALEAGGDVARAVSGGLFPDAAIRAEVVRILGPGDGPAAIDHCGWDAEARVVIPRTSWQAKKLAKLWSQDLDWTIGETGAAR